MLQPTASPPSASASVPAPVHVLPTQASSSVTGEIAGVVKKLDPNMLSVLLLTVALNSMFFYVYVEVARTRHVEFLAALNSCPIRGSTPLSPTP